MELQKTTVVYLTDHVHLLEQICSQIWSELCPQVLSLTDGIVIDGALLGVELAFEVGNKQGVSRHKPDSLKMEYVSLVL